MSAFMVTKTHIDLLLMTALEGPKLERNQNRQSWYRIYFGNEKYVEFDNLNSIGEMLVKENLSSIHARYPDTVSDPTDTPGPCDQYWLMEFVFEQPPRRLSAVEALKAISCYEYQSCEHPEWKASEAASFCESLRHQLISRLPGYEDAPWEWNDELVRTPTARR